MSDRRDPHPNCRIARELLIECINRKRRYDADPVVHLDDVTPLWIVGVAIALQIDERRALADRRVADGRFTRDNWRFLSDCATHPFVVFHYAPIESETTTRSGHGIPA